MTGAEFTYCGSSPDFPLKELQLEKERIEQALVSLRLDYDDYKTQSTSEKRQLLDERDRAFAIVKELLMELSKHRGETEPSPENHEEEAISTSALVEKALVSKRKELVTKTWEAVQDSLNVEATKIFYKRLFDTNPSVAPLFKGDVEVQAAKLYQALSLAVESLSDLDALLPVLVELGERHATSFRVERQYYDAVGECLLWTLKAGLGDAWSDEVADAWAWVYGVVSKIMADAGDKALLERRKSIIQKTWADVEATLNVEATRIFYQRLFQTHPTLIPLFNKGDLELQAAKLYQTLSAAVATLDSPSVLIPKLEELGARHAINYEVEPAHYDAVGECLLWTLQNGLGKSWTENVADAWTWLYGLISRTMADAGEKAKLDVGQKPTNISHNETTSSQIAQLEMALFQLRIQTDDKIKNLEKDNRRVIVEKEELCNNMKELLLKLKSVL